MDGKCGYGVEKASGASGCTRTGAGICPAVAFDCGMPGWDWLAGGAGVVGWGLALEAA